MAQDMMTASSPTPPHPAHTMSTLLMLNVDALGTDSFASLRTDRGRYVPVRLLDRQRRAFPGGDRVMAPVMMTASSPMLPHPAQTTPTPLMSMPRAPTVLLLCGRMEADAFLRGCPIAKGGHFPAEIV
jgi:hypothetical protein